MTRKLIILLMLRMNHNLKALGFIREQNLPTHLRMSFEDNMQIWSVEMTTKRDDYREVCEGMTFNNMRNWVEENKDKIFNFGVSIDKIDYGHTLIGMFYIEGYSDELSRKIYKINYV